MVTLIVVIIVIVALGRIVAGALKYANAVETRAAARSASRGTRLRPAGVDHRPDGGQNVSDWYTFSPEERDRRIEEAISRYPEFDHHFYSKAKGVSHSNSDGTSRQEIIRTCRIGELLELVPEPDNPVDENALATEARQRRAGRLCQRRYCCAARGSNPPRNQVVRDGYAAHRRQAGPARFEHCSLACSRRRDRHARAPSDCERCSMSDSIALPGYKM